MSVPHRRRAPARARAEPELLFCANCQVSVAAIELERGAARRTPKGRIFCALCTRAKPAERAMRRRALEQEFADDAPIFDAPTPAGPRVPAATADPTPVSPRLSLDDRVGQLERAVLRMQEQLHRIERLLNARRGRL